MRYEEERRREAERHEEEQRKYEEARRVERKEERRRYEALLEKLTTGKRKVEIGPESLKLTKLNETEDIEAFLTTFERAVEAHNVEPEKWAPILAPQLTGKGQEAYAAMEIEDAKDYQKVKQAILQRYNINEETYQQSFRSVKPKEEETPVELVTRIRGLAEKWLKKCETREQVIDTIVKEQFVLALPVDVRVWVMERRPLTSAEAGQLAENYHQARKLKQWEPVKKDASKRCYECGRTGHIARDCVTQGEGEKKRKPSKGAEVKKKESELTCFNCRGGGHTSWQCPSKVMFCGVRRKVNCKSGLRRQDLMCRGAVEGVDVDDILLDTGCSRTLVR